jgi:hypothetical protein
VNRIVPLLRTGGRLINLASAGHRFANVDHLNRRNSHSCPVAAGGSLQRDTGR